MDTFDEDKAQTATPRRGRPWHETAPSVRRGHSGDQCPTRTQQRPASEADAAAASQPQAPLPQRPQQRARRSGGRGGGRGAAAGAAQRRVRRSGGRVAVRGGFFHLKGAAPAVGRAAGFGIFIATPPADRRMPPRRRGRRRTHAPVAAPPLAKRQGAPPTAPSLFSWRVAIKPLSSSRPPRFREAPRLPPATPV